MWLGKTAALVPGRNEHSGLAKILAVFSSLPFVP